MLLVSGRARAEKIKAMLSSNNGLAIQTEKTDLVQMIPLLWEIGNLKRIKPAHLPVSLATDFFRRAWGRINGGADLRRVAINLTADAIVSAQLGAIDRLVLQHSGLSAAEIRVVIERAFDLSAGLIEKSFRDELRQTLTEKANLNSSDLPFFVEKLSKQPRSGATKPGAQRFVFDAPENHAEHSIIVGIYGVLLAPLFNADIATVFLTALAHHFHNADLPDAGFAGEELLGEFLPAVFRHLREQCLSELSENLRETVRQTFALTTDACASESKAFHAADVIDRVLQMRHHGEANQFNLKYALEEMELVHAGAVQSFHYEILSAAKLIS